MNRFITLASIPGYKIPGNNLEGDIDPTPVSWLKPLFSLLDA
jgi:hypothetical protein